MLMQLAIGLATGIFAGVAIFSKPFSRAVVTGLIAGVTIGAITVHGVEHYLHWVNQLPVLMAKFTAFWAGLFAGILGGARFWPTLMP